MLKTLSKFASKSILAFVNRQLRSIRRKAFQYALASGFQRLEPRRVLTVQGIFDAATGNLSVNITPGGNTSATLAGLDATNYFLDIDGNSQFDPGSDLFGIKADLKNILVNGTADPLGNIGSFTWRDHLGSSFQLDRILASDLASISLDLVAQVSVAQDSALRASHSITIENTASPSDPAKPFLRFANNLTLDAASNNGTILVDLDYQLTVDQDASFQATQGSIRLSDIDANTFHAVARGDILDADSGVDSTDIRANLVSLTSTTGSIGNALSDILKADIATTTQQSLEIASRSHGIFSSSFVATQGTVSIHTDEFPLSVDTNKLWLVSDSDINATDLSGLSSRVTDLALVINPASMTPSSLIALPDSLSIAGDLRIESHAVTASDASIDLEANRILWKSIQEAELTITANQVDAESVNALKILSTDTIRIADLDNNLVGLRAKGHLAFETAQGSIFVDSLIVGNQSTNVLIKTNANGTIQANAMIQSGSGNITLSSREALVLEDRIRTAAPGSIVLESQGSITLGATST
ncbi:MAG: hypothetical protein NTV29_09085, partial [Planctomycetota bacterium]|nr:hypothetical protein [Planctomycetota bacterium]